MTAKEYLKQYEEALQERYKYEKEIESLREQYDAIGSVTDYDGMPHGSNISHPTEDKAIRVADRINEIKPEYADAILKCIDTRDKVFKMVMRTRGTEQDVLYARYIQLYSWDRICKEIGYEWTQTHEYHKRALRSIQKLLNSE